MKCLADQAILMSKSYVYHLGDGEHKECVKRLQLNMILNEHKLGHLKKNKFVLSYCKST